MHPRYRHIKGHNTFGPCVQAEVKSPLDVAVRGRSEVTDSDGNPHSIRVVERFPRGGRPGGHNAPPGCHFDPRKREVRAVRVNENESAEMPDNEGPLVYQLSD